MLSKSKIFFKGIVAVLPHMLSVIPFGIITGAIGVELGFDPILVYATSLIIFGGASQIIFMQLLSGGASSLVAITSVGVINSRHLLYGAVLSEYLEKLSFIKKLFISYFIVDQGFAESNKYIKQNKNLSNPHYYVLGTGVTLWFCWQLSTISGIILGSFIPEELGLKFAIPLTFLAIIVNDLRKLDHVFVMLVSGFASLILFDAPFKSYIILSPIVALIAAFIMLRFKKMTWFSIIVSGIVTYFSRMAMVALIDREMLGTKVKEVLNYVPAAVFPAIIFPGVFFNDFGSLVEITDPKIYGAIVALIVGFFSQRM